MNFSEYVGIPFKPHGRDRDGVDCWGLVWLIYKERFEILLPSFTEEYDTVNDGILLGELTTSQRDIMPWREVEHEQIGDVVLLRLFGFPMHVGLVVSKRLMINVRVGVNVCIENFRSTAWKKRIEGIYRYVG